MNADLSTKPGASRAIPWLVLTTVLWGGSFVFNKIGFREIPPISFMAMRFTLAALLMGALCLGRLCRLDAATVRKGVGVGLALAGANLTFVLGVDGTTVSRAGFLNNLFVLIVPLLCYLLWRSRVDGWTLSGVAVAVAGLAVLAGGGTGGFSRGDFFSLVCSLFISLHIILVSRLLREVDVFLVTLVQFATVAVCGAALALTVARGPFSVGPSSMLALLYCVIFPTVICFTLQNTFQRYVTPTQAGLIYTLDPIWSLLGGMLLLGERLTPGEWLGCALIFAAVALPSAARLLRERSGLRPPAPAPGLRDPS
jgi:drug/metabolite transporter (DMT)-like permease